MKAILASGVISLLALTPALDAFAGGNASINLKGEVSPETQQFTVSFSEPFFAIGQWQVKAPFNVDCGTEGKGTWVDPSTWVFRFKEPLGSGRSCKVTAVGGVESPRGNPVTTGTAGNRFEFNTGHPELVETFPSKGTLINEDEPVFLMRFNVPISKELLARLSFCQLDASKKTIPIGFLSEAETLSILQAALSSDEERAFRAREIVGVRCSQALPSGAAFHLVYGGRASDTKPKIEPSGLTRIPYKTRPPFLLEVTQPKKGKSGLCAANQVDVKLNGYLADSQASRIKLCLSDSPQRCESGSISDERSGEPSGFATEISFYRATSSTGLAELHVPKDLVDVYGRNPKNVDRFPLTIPVYKPERVRLLSFTDSSGTIENTAEENFSFLAQDSEKRLTLKHEFMGVEALWNGFHRFGDWFDSEVQESPRKLMTKAKGKVGGHLSRTTTKPLMISRTISPELSERIGIALQGSGLHFLEFQNGPSDTKCPETTPHERRSALVQQTDLAVHTKLSRGTIRVWVTSMKTGKPVANATVVSFDCFGKRSDEQHTDSRGLATVPASQSCRDEKKSALLAVRTDRDITIQPAPTKYWYSFYGSDSDLIVHTIFAKNIVRPGELLQMKHLFRVPSESGLKVPERGNLPRYLVVRNLGESKFFTVPLDVSADGSATTSFRIPAEAKERGYLLGFFRDAPNERRSEAMLRSEGFRVERYKLDALVAKITVPEEPQTSANPIPIEFSLKYINGGPAAKQKVKQKIRLLPSYLSFVRGWSDYSFDADPVQTDSEVHSRSSDAGYDEPFNGKPFRTEVVSLDANGQWKGTIQNLPASAKHRELEVEFEYVDPSGSVAHESQRVALWPQNIVLGVRPPDVVHVGEKESIQVLALDRHNKPVPNQKVVVRFFESETSERNVHVLGSFWDQAGTTSIRLLGEFCTVTTNAEGKGECTGVVRDIKGELIFEASTRAAEGSTLFATENARVERLETNAEKRVSDLEEEFQLRSDRAAYAPGDVAKVSLTNPFSSATVLITVEREGILWEQVRELRGGASEIALPILQNYYPNIVVSAVLFRGRDTAKAPTNDSDPGRPLALEKSIELHVDTSHQMLKVAVIPEKEIFTPRETVKAKVRVSSDFGPLPQGTIVTFLAVDEALAKVAPNESWDILSSMMKRRDHLVETRIGMKDLIERRKSGSVSLLSGLGGGGGDLVTAGNLTKEDSPSRQYFDPLVFWEANLKLDEKGEADVVVPLNDSLTAFRLVAIAVSLDKFGTGSALIQSQKTLSLFSAVPQTLRWGDSLRARFTARNSGAKPVDATFLGGAYDVQGKALGELSVPQRFTLQAGQSKEVSFDTVIPQGGKEVSLGARLSAKDSESDEILVNARTVSPNRETIIQSSQGQIRGDRSIPLAEPPGDRASVHISTSKTTLSNLGGIEDYMRSYGYSCLEQQTSKAVALNDDAAWDRIIKQLPQYLDERGLAKFFPVDRQGSVELTQYILLIAKNAQKQIPISSQKRMLQGVERVFLKSLREQSANGAELASEDAIVAAHVLSEYQHLPKVRLGEFRPRIKNLTNSALLSWALFLKNETSVLGREQLLNSAFEEIRSRLIRSATTVTLVSRKREPRNWSSDRSIPLSRLILATLKDSSWRPVHKEMLNGLLGLASNGHYSTTVGNAWAATAIRQFSRTFDKGIVSGTTTFAVDSLQKIVTWDEKVQDDSFTLPWPNKPGSKLKFIHSGKGAPWYSLRARAHVALKEPVAAGFFVEKTIEPLDVRSKGVWSQGDLARVTIKVFPTQASSWVVVDDPFPPDSEVVYDVENNGPADGTWPTYEETNDLGRRFYFDSVSGAAFSINYVIRLQQAGTFLLPPTHVEAMYEPELHGDVPNKAVTVLP